MNLAEALQPDLPARIAIVGGGGKTTAMFQLARQIDGPVWVTTTTHLGTDQLDLADKHFLVNSAADLDVHQLKMQKISLVTGPFTPDDRVRGPAPEVLARLFQLAEQEQVSLIVEADGSRSHPIKAPAEHEPAIPAWAKMVITVAGLSALDQPLNQDWVHRPEQFSRLTGLGIGQPISIESLARLLTHPEGGLKGTPAGSINVVLLNQADSAETQASAKKIILKLLSEGYAKVIIGGLKSAPQSLECYQSED